MKVRGIVVAVVLAWSPPAFAASTAGSEFQVNTYTTYDQSFPGVCSRSTGDFVVVWETGTLFPQGQDGSYLGIAGQRFAGNGAKVGTEFIVNTYTSDYQTFPRTACAQNGRFVVVWTSYAQDGDSNGIFGQRFDSTGTRDGGEFQVNTYTTGVQDYPSIASDAIGNFVVVWASAGPDGDTFGVFGKRFSSNGQVFGSEFRINTYTTAEQDYPTVAVADTGAFVVTWSSEGQDGGGRGIFAQRYGSNGVALGNEFRVNTYTPMDQDYPSVAVDQVGNFIVVWASTGQDGGAGGIFGQRFGADGNAVGAEFRVNTYTTGQQALPDVAADSVGNFMVSWSSYGEDGDNAGVFGQRYASNGTTIGGEFQANTYTTGLQYSGAVAAPAPGQFVLVWASQHDGDSNGVFGQRYADPTPTSSNTATPSRTPPPPATATGVATATRTATRTSTRTRTTTRTMVPTETPSASATATAEPSATQVPTATDTPIPSDTPTPPATATPTPPPITGDCDGDGEVSISELVRGIRIALGTLGPEACRPFDRDANGEVSISELVAAVNAALEG